MITKAQSFSGEFPLGVIGQLGGIDISVAVAMDTVNHLPMDLILWFLEQPHKKFSHI